MHKPAQAKKNRYEKPQVVSKRVEFMTSTFATTVAFGPYRHAPRRSEQEDQGQGL